MFELLEKLCTASAPSGCEKQVRELIEKEISPYVDSVETDVMGNLIACKKGSGKKLMFAAHMDEIGVIATCHGEKGQVYVSALGGVDPYASLFQRVRFLNGTEGVLALDGTNDLLKSLTMQKLYADVGAKNEEEAKKLVPVGEAGVFVGDYKEQNGCVISKALDNRVGCFILIEAIKKMKQNKNDLYFVFTVSEELGLRGAKTAAFTVNPDYAVAIDVTRTGDVPSSDKMALELKKGVIIKVMDRSFIAHPLVKERMVTLCEQNKIEYQMGVLEKGGTDAGAIHLSGGGVPTGVIAIPTRYIHTPGEIVAKSDVENAILLATALIEEGIA
ncbi:MAG: M42 family metallopeptidase [Clostridia bacterium]|nr:M42 family metallopeptidase [Clostridia bacterium]